MYFEDLSPYSYLGGRSTPNVLNVGWLAEGREFPRGEVSQKQLERLQELAARPVNRCRGSHACEFCSHASGAASLACDARGNGEIRVPGPDGKLYAAPTLIVHYVSAHGYLPPEEFLRALSECR